MQTWFPAILTIALFITASLAQVSGNIVSNTGNVTSSGAENGAAVGKKSCSAGTDSSGTDVQGPEGNEPRCGITSIPRTGVLVIQPEKGHQVNSPVTYTASASTTSCTKGVASMGVYVNNALVYVANGHTLNTSLALSPGNYQTTVEEWDHCGGSAYTPVAITVGGQGQGNVLSNLQSSPGWVGYGELPPEYNICSAPCDGVTWSMQQGVQNPSMSGHAAQFNLGGTTPYSDVLFTNPLIGQNSTQGLPDSNHTLLPALHNFTYDSYFYLSDLSAAQVLEFDISMYFNGLSLIWGHQCNILGGNEWDIWDNVNAHWVSAGVSCYPKSNSWNHVTLQVQRESDDTLLFQSITLNGVTTPLNQYYAPASAPGNWWGVTVNYQMDGNHQQAPYTTYVDDFSLTYW